MASEVGTSNTFPFPFIASALIGPTMFLLHLL